MLENTTARTRRLTIGAIGAVAAGALMLGIAAPASAGEVIAAEIVAAEPAAAPRTVMDVPMAVASKPRAITVSNHKGKSVVLFAKGEKIRRNLAPGKKPVTFSKLTAGRVYTVSVGGEPIGTVVALNAPAAASGLRVSTTDTIGTVALEWNHKTTRATGGDDVEFVVTATSTTAEPVSTTVVGVHTAELSGLEPEALYSFSVTPKNSAGSGKATKASMTRTLQQLTGGSVKPEPVPAVPESPVPAPVPAPAPAPAPGPSTRTIWVCPDGYSEAGGQCETTTPYTFHTETETRAYTYSSVQTGTRRNTDNQTCGYLPDANGNPVVECWGGFDEPVYSNVKDATPAGFTDNGSSWVRDVEVKDAAPTGYADNGSAWVKTAAKVQRTVPA